MNIERYKIEIFGKNEQKIQPIEEVIQPLQNIQGYSMKILWIDGESESDEYSIFELQEVIDKQDGILLDYKQLENLCYKMEAVTELLIIADRDEKNLFYNIEDENLYDNDIVLELVSNSHWQMITSDINLVKYYKEIFPNSKIIE